MMVVAAPPAGAPAPLKTEKPRVISEIKKTSSDVRQRAVTPSPVRNPARPRISGDLEMVLGDSEGSWESRHVEVKEGTLLTYKLSTNVPEFRLPLRYLNLKPCASRPRAFSLVTDKKPLASFQAPSEELYERWVKTVAVELIRQTPLEAVKFLDILGITAMKSPKNISENINEMETTKFIMKDKVDSNTNSISKVSSILQTSKKLSESELNKAIVEKRIRALNFKENGTVNGKPEIPGTVNRPISPNVPRRCANNRASRPRTVKSATTLSNGNANGHLLNPCRPIHSLSCNTLNISDEDNEDQKALEALEVFCQTGNATVKDKRILFESYILKNRHPHVQSMENLHMGQARSKTKRARSLHDLSCASLVTRGCQIFEEYRSHSDEHRSHSAEPKDHWTSNHINAYLARRRAQLGEHRLEHYKQKISECEETIWKIQNDMAELDKCRQTLSCKKTEADTLYRALECKRMQEEERMAVLQNAAARTLKEIERDSEKFETALGQSVNNNNE